MPVFNEFAFANVPGFDNGSININARFFVLCGGTGVGKSALLQGIYSTLLSREEKPPVHRHGDATFTLSINHPTGTYVRGTNAADDNGNLPDADVRLVTLSNRTSTLVDFLEGKDTNIMIEPYEARQIDRKDLASISSACRKSFESIAVYEIEDGDEVVPYFVATAQGYSYDSRSMGTGELSVVYLAWLVSSIKPHSILLIEEPEAYLPPTSHSAVFDLLARGVAVSRSALCITSHSTEIIAGVPERLVFPVKKKRDISYVETSPERKEGTLHSLGLIPSRDTLILVEDQLAKIITQELLSSYSSRLLARAEVASVRDKGGIKKILELMPADIKHFSFIGVADGDIADEVAKWSCRDRILFLPFVDPIEKELLSSGLDYVEELSIVSQRTLADISDAFEHINGLEHHRAFAEFCQRTGLSLEAASLNLLRVWRKKSDNSDRAITFAKGIVSMIA